MLKFVNFLLETLNEGDFHLIYSDTDSITIGTTKTRQRERAVSNGKYDVNRRELMEDIFLPIVKPQKLDFFLNEWENWLVLTGTFQFSILNITVFSLENIRDEKTTGKLKVIENNIQILTYT